MRPFPGGGALPGSRAGGQWQISAGGGRYPRWSRNGNELFYQAPDTHIMVTEYTVKGDSFVLLRARQWSDKRLLPTSIGRNYDVAPDGNRLAVFPLPEAASRNRASVHVTVLLNFFDEMRRTRPAK